MTEVICEVMGIMIREAEVKDSARIAEIEVKSCRFAYKDIVPEEHLFKEFTVERRIPVYESWIGEKRFELYVYEDSGSGVIKGMMGIGDCGDEDKKGSFELHFIYVDPEFVRAGIGSELLSFFESKGREKGFSEFVVWVLEENRMGRNFYEKNGYLSDGKHKMFKRWNKREIRYVKN